MKKRKLKRYIITTAVGLVVAGIVFAYESTILDADGSELIRMFSDGFFVSGILMLCATLLCFVSNGGGFDSFAYLGHKMRHMFRRDKSEKLPDYYTFVTERREKGKIPLLNILLVSIGMLILSFIFAFLA